MKTTEDSNEVSIKTEDQTQDGKVDEDKAKEGAENHVDVLPSVHEDENTVSKDSPQPDIQSSEKPEDAVEPDKGQNSSKTEEKQEVSTKDEDVKEAEKSEIVSEAVKQDEQPDSTVASTDQEEANDEKVVEKIDVQDSSDVETKEDDISKNDSGEASEVKKEKDSSQEDEEDKVNDEKPVEESEKISAQEEKPQPAEEEQIEKDKAVKEEKNTEEEGKPKEEDGKPEEEDGKPEEKGGKPEEVDGKPEEKDRKPEEEDGKPGVEKKAQEENGQSVEKSDEANIEPPVFDVPTENAGDDSKPSDFYYDYEEYASTSYVSPESGIPENILHLFHSFGYDSKKKSNLSLLPGPTAVFAAGNLVHLLDLSANTHKFLRSSSGGGIGAVTVHPELTHFAVAEKGQKPHILIYEFPSLKLFRILQEGTERAYSFVDFNPNGNLLASVGCAPDFMLTVWDWINEKIMLRTKAFSQDIFRVKFAPEQEGQLCSSGTGHIRFWKMARTFTGLKLKGELGRFGKTSLSDIGGFVQLPDGKVLSGSEWGNLLLWDGGLIKVEICRKGRKSCHAGSIQQLVIDEGELITIGVDGFVRVWEMESIDTADTTDESDVFEVEPMNELKVGSEVQLTSMVKLRETKPADESEESIESIWFAQDANGGIWKLDLSFSHTTKPPEKLYSYTAGKISGLTASPASHMVAVTGDTSVRIYDYLTKDALCEYKCPMLSNSSSILWPGKLIYAKSNILLVGFSNGLLRSLILQTNEDEKSLTLQQVLKPHTQEVTALAIHPDDRILATGSKDQTVFFFKLNSVIEPIGFVSVPGPVSHLQWSPDSFSSSTLLVCCSNGKVAEVAKPGIGAFDTSHSYKLTLPMKYFSFQSIKSQLRRDEARERKRIEKENKLKEKKKELKRRKDRGEEFSEEEEREFLNVEEEEEEEEPLFFPAKPSLLHAAFYSEENKFILSVGDYDAGYLYECEFSSDAVSVQNPDIAPAEPINSLAVPESNDIPATTIYHSQNAHCLLVGFQNGIIRVHPLEKDINMETFKMDVITLPYWQLSMHDNETGFVSSICESNDGAFLFTGGNDGNIYGYNFLPFEEVYKAMEGQRARLPSARKDADEVPADDIDDPQAYSIEDAKLKAEHDRYMKEAEAKKAEERQKIQKLRHIFTDIIKKNDQLPENVRLKREDFELDPSLRVNMHEATNKRIERVRLEMQWEKEKLNLATRKLKNRFSDMIDCPRITLHALNSEHTVSSYRITRLADEYFKLEKNIAERARLGSLDGGNIKGRRLSDGLDIGRKQSTKEELEHQQSFLQGAVKKQKGTTLQGRQAEKVAKAIKKAEEAKKKREQRQKEWDDLYKSKPAENYEDPADISDIQEAKANIGDFKLKTASDYVVPEHLRMDTEKKKTQILILQGLIFQAKKEFNTKLTSLRDNKQSRIGDIKEWVKELKEIQKKLNGTLRKTLPKVPKMKPDELPERKYDYTRDTLLEFQALEKERELADASKKRSGMGMFGGFDDEGGQDGEAEGDKEEQTTKSVKSSSTPSRSRHLSKASKTQSRLEIEIAKINEIKLVYQRNKLLRLINQSITAFDAELHLLRHEKTHLDVDIKMADLRQITLLEELILLKEYEKRENTLSGRVSGKRMELNDVYTKVADMQVKLESKRRDIEKLTDREKQLYATFNSYLGDNNKFADFLTRVFKKKIKRAKKKKAEEGEEEEGSDMSSDDESDWSSEEEEDDSIEGGFDDSVCPPGCDQQLFDDVLNLREKRLDLEEALVEEKKIADQQKKDMDSLVKKSKVMESQLKTALDALEEFQVEKQGKLNELDVVVPLHLHQVEHVSNGVVPADLSSCLVFTNQSLIGLQRRIKELQHEKAEQRSLFKDARMSHVRLIKDRKIMEQKIERLEEKCEQMMMLKFGRIVDLDKLDSITINKTVEELKQKVHQNELKNSAKLLRLDNLISELKDTITQLTRVNTRHLEKYNILVNQKTSLEKNLDQRQKDLNFDQNGDKKSDTRERQRLMQLVQLQAQEIQALKEEIGLLSRKGGHILPPAQPPITRDDDL
ncbi:cilia- and flagella-associated protein 44-like isoform X2 [Styela clava]